jgi:deoxyribodipyrimidine photo-lyase
LKAAHSEGLPVIHLYVFDPFWYPGRSRLCSFTKTGTIRTRFQLEAVEDLDARLRQVGHSLSMRTGISTRQCFEELCQDYSVNAVFAFREICSEEVAIERAVTAVLRKQQQGPLKLYWGFELYHRDDLDFDPARNRQPFASYTAFRKRLEARTCIRPSSHETPRFQNGDKAVWWAKAETVLPTVQFLMGAAYNAAEDPGSQMYPRAELKWKGGETAALDRVKNYLWESDSLGLDYVGATMTMDVAKSCMRDKAMSKISPWLAHGCLSPRLLYEEVKRYEKERTKSKSTYWITHELLWRDFVRFGSMFAGTSIFKIGGPSNVHPKWRWSSSRETLTAWCEGKTGFPFIDCFMRELKTTGYCNHMGRECAGWFLIGDLGLDWRMAAEWFEMVLIDYEPTANWYNWVYRCLPAAQRGGPHGFLTDDPGHHLQGLEILKWGTQHDPDSTYIKRWVPELSSLPALIAREPWRLGLNNEGGSHRGLRPLPQGGSFNVNKQALEAVLGMGFGERDAAAALYRVWNDPDRAVRLLLGEEGEEEEDEDPELAEALKLSMQDSNGGSDVVDLTSDGNEAKADDDPSKYTFRYGIDYPKPIIQPVSLHGTEESADQARKQQAERDRQVAASRRRNAQRYNNFDKDDWEVKKRQWPAETPTSAGYGKSKGKGPVEHGDLKSKGKGYGKRNRHDMEVSDANASSNRLTKDSVYLQKADVPSMADSDSKSVEKYRHADGFNGKRRWAAKDKSSW